MKKIDGIYSQIKKTLTKSGNKKKIAWGSLITVVLGILFVFLFNFSFLFFAKATITPTDQNGNSSVKEYTKDQDPTFILDTKKLVNDSSVIDTGLYKNGNPVETKPIVSSLSETGKFKIKIAPDAKFPPGHYELKVDVSSPKKAQTLTQDFTWGVLVMNFNQSTYKVGENALIGVGVLDDRGKTVCDATVNLTITDPKGNETFLMTKDRTVSISKDCMDQSVTNNPDYFAEYIPKNIGQYKVHISAETRNGPREGEQSFEVITNDDFVVTRHDTSMRIWPGSSYNVHITVQANNNFQGQIAEEVPESFMVSNINAEGKLENNKIIWPADIVAGNNIELSYTYKPPFVSPEFYLLRLAISDANRKALFSEPHPWQIASDSACTSAATGNWAAIASWNTPCNVSTGPIAGDSVQINNANVITIPTGTRAPASGNVTTISIVTATTAVTHGITLAGTGQLFTSGAVTINGSTLAGNGSLIVASGTVTVPSIAFVSASTGLAQVTVTTGIINMTGALTNSGTTAANARYVSTSTSNLNIGGNFMPGAMTGTTGGTITFNGTSITQTMVAATLYRNVIVNGTSNIAQTQGATTINTNLTVTAGTFQMGAAGAHTVTGTTSVTGTLNTAVGATGNRTFTGLVTINANGVWDLSNQNPPTLFNGGITNNGTTFNNGAGSTTFTANQTLQGSTNLTFGGAWIVNTGVTVTVSRGTSVVGVTLNAAGTANGISIGSGITLNNTGTTTMNAPSAAVASTLAVGAGIYNSTSITMNGGGTSGWNSILSLSTGTVTVNGDIICNTANTAQQQITFTGAGVISLNGNFASGANACTLAGSTGKVQMTASAADKILGDYTTYYDVEVATTNGRIITTEGATTITHNLTVTSGNFRMASATAHNINGTTSVTGTVSASAIGAWTFGNTVTVNSTGTFDLTGSTPTTSFAGNITNSTGASAFNSGTGATTFAASLQLIGTVAMTFGGATTINSGFVVTNNNSAAVTFSNTITAGNASSGITTGSSSDTIFQNTLWTATTGVLTPAASANTIEYNQAGAQTVATTTTNNYWHLKLGGASGAKTMTGITVITGDLTIGGGATMTSNAAFVLAGILHYDSSGNTTLAGGNNIQIGQLNQTAGILTDSGVTITISGTGATTWDKPTGTFTPTGTVIFTGASPEIGATNFNNLTITVGTSAKITGALDVGGNFSVTAGNFNTNSQNQSFAGNFSLSLGTTYTKGGTLTFDKVGSQVLTDSTAAPGRDLGVVTIGPSTTTSISTANKMNVIDLTIGADDTLDISSNTLSIGGNFINSNTLTTTGSTVDFTKGSSTQTLNSGGTGAGKPFNNLTHSGAGTLQLITNAINIDGIFTNSNGTFDANDLNMNVADDFLISGGSFSADVSPGATTQTVTFDGTNEATISGSNTFRNLTMNSTTDGAKTIKFTAATTQTINNTWTLDGDVGKVLTLRSTTDTNVWKFVIPADINPAGDYIDVRDSQNTTNAYRITSGAHYVDAGNNVPGWLFPPANTAPNDPISLAQKKTTDVAITVNTWTNETSVKFTATASDTDNPDTLYLCIEKDQTGTAFSNTEDSCGTGVAYSGTPVAVTNTISSQTDATAYHWQARIKDAANAYSNWVTFGGNTDPNDMDYGIDTTAPTGGSVVNDANTGSLVQLSATWNSFDTTVSGIQKYQYAVGTTSGGSDIKAWTDNSPLTQVFATASGLNLQTSANYYFSVKAFDNAGNTGSAVSASAQKVTPTLSFSLDSNSVTFSNLNAGNSWTDTKTTAVHTVTNAASGYSVRAYATGLLTSIVNGSLTIPNYASPYSSPTTWTGTGFGYTVNDQDINSVDKWTSSTKFCAFSLSSPGDIIADHEAAVNGSTGNADDTYTLTYKVVAPNAQAASTYQTIIYYIATANF